ncbi:MAG: hypothetical protein HGB08_02825 [Candidatus Moranbacteria bacterium]|nr:hypothetical protein [Candidatus Moranbacteria bacterium]
MARKIAEEISREEAAVTAQPKKKRKYFFKVIVFLIIVGLAGVAAYYYKQYKKIKDNPQVVSQEETQFVISELGKLMELPEGTPSMATVQDKEKLKDQSFFKKAENGDKVLIYADAKQAILFRPSTKKIIEVAPLLLHGNEPTGEIGENSNKDESN